MPKFLFIAGSPRSGTTGLVELLNKDSRMIIGVERFKYIHDKITPEHFTEATFFSPKKEETNKLDHELLLPELQERYRSGNWIYMGEKDPGLATKLDYLVDTFPNCKLLFLYRDLFSVASSFNNLAYNPRRSWPEKNDYRAALWYWEKFNACSLRFAQEEHADQLFIVRYESFFSGSVDYLEAMYEFLDLSLTDSVRDAFRSATEGWQKRQAKPLQMTGEMREYLEKNRDMAIKEACDELCPPGL